MSRKAGRLEQFGRPKTTFDPKNKLHRGAYLDFVETGSWRNCPVSFIVDDDSLSVIYCIERKMLSYYLKREFGQDREPKVLHRSEGI